MKNSKDLDKKYHGCADSNKQMAASHEVDMNNSEASSESGPAYNRLSALSNKIDNLQAFYQSKYDDVSYSKTVVSKTIEKISENFVAPSPFFSFIHRYPTLAGYTNQLLYWDTSLCIRINRFSRHDTIATFFKVISRLGDGVFWYTMLVIAALMGGFEQWYVLAGIISTNLFGVLIYKLLKEKTVRPRPYKVHQVIKLGERPLDVFSFPSGHTLQAVLFTCSIGLFFPALLWIMVPFATLVALSRMVLGLHYPTDVMIGAGLGFALSFLSPKVVHMFSLLTF